MVYAIEVNVREKSFASRKDEEGHLMIGLGRQFYGAFAGDNSSGKFLILAYRTPFRNSRCIELNAVSDFVGLSGLSEKVEVGANDFFDPRDATKGTAVVLTAQSDDVRFAVSSD